MEMSEVWSQLHLLCLAQKYALEGFKHYQLQNDHHANYGYYPHYFLSLFGSRFPPESFDGFFILF